MVRAGTRALEESFEELHRYCLLAAAWLAWTRGWSKVATALAVAALVHFAWFSLVLHNPLWSEQAVGAVPVVNLLLPAFAVGLAAVLTLRRWLSGAAKPV